MREYTWFDLIIIAAHKQRDKMINDERESVILKMKCENDKTSINHHVLFQAF